MHLREYYHQQLDAIQADLDTMGEQVRKAIHASLDALRTNDLDLAERVIADDEAIDRTQHFLEERAIALMATQQPVATDLRRLVASIAIASELERIGDYAKSTAKVARRHTANGPIAVPDEIFQMATQAEEMLGLAMQAFQDEDDDAARTIAARDDILDGLRHRVQDQVLQGNGTNSSSGLFDTLFVAYNIERIGDRVTNIAERVVYLATGEMVTLN